ncbi:hypothetical protein [Bacillus anthracis]
MGKTSKYVTAAALCSTTSSRAAATAVELEVPIPKFLFSRKYRNFQLLENEINWPKGAKRVSYQVAPYSAMADYSLATITFTY